MKIAHIVTLISPDNAFGGPVKVAREQCAALARRGHDVHLFAAAPVAAPEVRSEHGYTLRLFPAASLMKALRFAGMTARGMAAAIGREAGEFDVAHIHLARDLVTLPIARTLRLKRVPYVVQPHGMITPSHHPLAAPVDGLATKRALRGASVALSLTSEERKSLLAVEPAVLTAPIANGVAVTPLEDVDREDLVLFLARLHPRKHAPKFVDMAARLLENRPDLTFIVAGPDEGDGRAVRERIDRHGIGSRVRWVGPIEPTETRAMMRRAKVYVLPSTGEVFPMSLLEAFQAGTPSVVTDSLGIAPSCREYGAAIVTDGTVEQLARATSRILDSAATAAELRIAAHRLLEERMDIEVVADDLEAHYASAIAQSPRHARRG